MSRRLANLNPKTFGYFLLILGFHNITAVTIGLCIGAIAPTVEGASALGTPVIIIMVLFGGFYINVDALPIVANWLPYLSFLRWTYQALLVNEFIGLEFSCGNSNTGACIKTGEEVISNLGFGDSTPQPGVFGLAMVFLGLLALLLFILEVSRMTYMPLGYTGSKYTAGGTKPMKKVSIFKNEKQKVNDTN